MLEVQGLEEFTVGVERWLDDVEETIAAVHVGIAKKLFEMMLPISPQFSGDFVANWNVSVDVPDLSFTPFAHVGSASHRLGDFIAGATPGMSEARSRNAGKAADFRLGQTIYITNSSKHDQYYAPLIEDERIKFRPGNAGAVIQRAVTDLLAGAHVLSTSEAEHLAATKF